jgi:hypothetical protein
VQVRGDVTGQGRTKEYGRRRCSSPPSDTQQRDVAAVRRPATVATLGRAGAVVTDRHESTFDTRTAVHLGHVGPNESAQPTLSAASVSIAGTTWL